MVASLGEGVDVVVVVIGAELEERVSGSARRCQMITSMERPTATMAFFLPRRRAMRR